MENRLNIIRTFIVENFLPTANDLSIDENMSFLESGLIDSTGVLELVDFLEERFEIEVKDSELVPENLDSISNICRYLDAKISGA